MTFSDCVDTTQGTEAGGPPDDVMSNVLVLKTSCNSEGTFAESYDHAETTSASTI